MFSYKRHILMGTCQKQIQSNNTNDTSNVVNRVLEANHIPSANIINHQLETKIKQNDSYNVNMISDRK